MSKNDVIWAMTSDADDFQLLPPEIKRLATEAENLGFCNFWYHPKHGLFADAPEAHMEDDRVLLAWPEVEYRKQTVTEGDRLHFGNRD